MVSNSSIKRLGLSMVICVGASSFLMSIPLVQGGTPHVVFGMVTDSEGYIPADADFDFIAYITTRPGEVLTKTALGCSYDEASGAWSIQCGNFPSPWAIGETLRVDLTDTGAGAGGNRTETSSAEGQLSGAGYDDFGGSSLPVEVSSFTATTGNGKVTLEWTTESETNNLGFRILRSEKRDGTYYTINNELLRGAGTSNCSNDYVFVDDQVEPNRFYFYKLEEVDTQGNTSQYGPIEAFVQDAIPTDFFLAQNHPNPFNPLTTISYGLPHDSHVLICVFNARGELISTLARDEMSPGFHVLSWNGTTDGGERVPSGIYFCRLVTGKFSQTRKLLLTK